MEKVDTKVFENAIGEIKNRLGIEKVVSEKSLYEDPKYSFLLEYKEYLGKIDASDIIGEGDNAIILKHKTKSDKVIKIAKDGKVDSLKDEYENHRTFYNTLEKGRPNNVPDNIRIAEIDEFIEHKKGIYIMDKIEGQSLYTWHYKEKYAEKLAIYSRENNIDINKVTDSKFIQILDELELGRVIGYNANLDMWEKMYQKELGAFRNGVVYRDDVQQALKYLEDNGLEHIDLHSKNIMASLKNGKFIIYIIDFGKVKINK
ncbi:MAG: hypothetical protein Q8K30_03630 [Candidatus Gracilibacteria bacterium]|nr:hypothetical protein [Candidatus Gracilibacteria bacterium]